MEFLMNMAVPSCKKATELIEKKIYFGLNPVEKVKLFLHLSMCDACSGYQKQSELLDELLQNYVKDKTKSEEAHFENKELKERIISKM